MIGLGLGLNVRSSRLGGIAPILDRLSVSPVAAYSLRRLRTAYAGFCIRVRRSSDNTERNIGFIGNVIDVVDLLAFVGAGDGFVVTKYDQSGNGFDATQATAANQPRIVSAGVLDIRNTRATTIYSGGQRFQTAAVINHSAELSACTVAFSDANNGSAIFQLGAINTLGSLFIESSNWLARTSGVPASTPYINNSLEQLSALYQNLSQLIYRRGVIGASAANALPSASNAVLTIGGLNNSVYHLTGGISELVLFPSTLSTADRQLLERDQGTYYGITVA